jgi:drug/metabolite transporter (DMT)-like permease
MTKSRRLAYLAMLGNVTIWGAALPVVKPALSVITPHQFLFLRFISVLPILILINLGELKKIVTKTSSFAKILAISLLGNLALLSLYVGLQNTSALEGSFITTIQPIIITFAGIIFLKEKEENHEWVGLILSLLGSLVIIFSPLLNSAFRASGSIQGNGLILGWALLATANILLVKRFLKQVPKSLLTTFDAIIATLLFGGLLISNHHLPSISQILHPNSLLAIFYMGILGTIVAYYFYYYGYQRIEASEATLFTYLQPLIYIPLAVFWLGDQLMPLQLIGLLIVITGVYIAERRPRKQRMKLKTHY